jgi:hypothetical protein
LKELHDQFGVEVSAWAKAIAECNSILKRRSFLSLWGTVVIFTGTEHAELQVAGYLPDEVPALGVPLDPHLRVLASTLALPEMVQLPLFAAMAVVR